MTPGDALVIAVSDDHAFLGAGKVLQVFDVSDPSEPSLVARVLLPGEILHVEVLGGYAYVSSWSYSFYSFDWSSRLHIIDVSDPQAPVEMGVHQDFGLPIRLFVWAGHAYLYYLENPEIQVIDVSDPTNPIRIGSIGNHSDDFEIANGLLYRLSWLGLEILDLSDPLNPVMLGTFGGSGWFLDRFLSSVFGSYAYIKKSSDYPNWSARGIEIIDVSDPSDPVFVGTYVPPDPDEDVYRTAASGTDLFVFSNIYKYPNPNESWLRVIDVSDPSRPVESGSSLLASGQSSPRDVAVSGSHLYAVDGGMRIVDCSDPSNPTKVSDYEPLGALRGVVVSESFAYGTSYPGGLHVIDLNDPENPVEVSSLELEFARDVAVSGEGHVFVVGLPYFAVIDVSDPYLPVQVGSADVRNVGGITYSNGLAYTTGHYGLSIVDPSIVHRPIEIGTYESIGPVSDVAISGGYAYAALSSDCGISCLDIVDISTPADPVGVAVYETGGEVGSVATDGDYVYLVRDGFRVIDVSEPSAPVEVASCDACSYSRKIVLSDRYAYVECDGTYVIDVRNPLSPIVVDSFGFRAGDIFLDGDFAYLATDLGLAIYSPKLCPFPMPNPHLPSSEVD